MFSVKSFFDTETNTHNIQLLELSLYAYADNRQEAEEQLIDLLMDYIQDYLDQLDFFITVPDRAKHYPLVKQLTGKTRAEVKRIIFAE